MVNEGALLHKKHFAMGVTGMTSAACDKIWVHSAKSNNRFFMVRGFWFYGAEGYTRLPRAQTDRLRVDLL